MRLMFLLAVVIATASLVALTLSPAAASDGRTQRSFTVSVDPAPVTLTVPDAGAGTGWVTSYPAGISCGTVCSAQFPSGTTVALYARTAIGSMFGGWATTPPPYLCGRPIGPAFPPGTSECDIFLDDSAGESASVQATFKIAYPCIAPGVKRETLANAKRSIKRHGCSVGKITYDLSNTVKKGRVLSQNPQEGWRREHGAKVNLAVSKGRR